MANGIKTKHDGDYCAHCDSKVLANVYNFCPKCSNPLNMNAIKLKEAQEKRIKLEVLGELAESLSDEQSLKIVLEKTKNV